LVEFGAGIHVAHMKSHARPSYDAQYIVNLNSHSESVSYTDWKSQNFYLKTKDNQEVKQMSSTFHHPSSTPPFLAPFNSKAHVLLNQTSANHCKSKAIPIPTPRPKTKAQEHIP
jgi:hypothetical protein